MPVIVDARGLACPHPVILAKEAIAENEAVTVLVDNPIAVENIRRLAKKTAAASPLQVRCKGAWTGKRWFFCKQESNDAI